MSVSIASWMNAFRFSEDLDALESIFQEDHRQHLEDLLRAEPQEKRRQESHFMDTPNPNNGPLNANDTQFLDVLSERIAARLGQVLSNSDALKQYLDFETLHRDNTEMAMQIQQLIQTVEAQQQTIGQLEQYVQQNQFKPLFGPFFIKA